MEHALLRLGRATRSALTIGAMNDSCSRARGFRDASRTFWYAGYGLRTSSMLLTVNSSSAQRACALSAEECDGS